MTKVCALCKIEKPLSAYVKRPERKGAPHSRCKDCRNAYARAWRERKKRENISAYRAQERRDNLRRYGLTPEEHDRMIAQQEGRCAICGNPPSGKQKALHIDHCHETGDVRGLLCHGCNTGLGLFKENTGLLKRAIGYLLGSG